ncbi:conserved hypothetical protein, membrane or secreted [Candidatus Magnetomorum sp. HK-1]|nr:conserved hypothetical protein, membrane or secreted [Candidatus Magnetomorum sp. HK-1]
MLIFKQKKLCLLNICMFALTITFLIPAMAFSGTTVSQTITLKAGWNAIFLEVLPEEPDLDKVFYHTPITQVLTFFPKNSSVQFIESPDEIDWKKDTWYRWVPPAGPEALLKNLHALQDNQAYLVFSTKDYSLTIKGTTGIKGRQWEPDSFNFFGFYVNPVAPPTFAQYFAGSRGHQNLQVYTLDSGIWKLIEEPDNVNIESGKAYWVYCEGGSKYVGPMEIDLPGTHDYLDYGTLTTEWELKIINRSPDPLSFTITPIPNEQGVETVPLSYVSYTNVTTKIYNYFMSESLPVVIEPGQSTNFLLAVRRDDIQGNSVSGLIKIADDLGNRYYVRVKAEK